MSRRTVAAILIVSLLFQGCASKQVLCGTKTVIRHKDVEKERMVNVRKPGEVDSAHYHTVIAYPPSGGSLSGDQRWEHARVMQRVLEQTGEFDVVASSELRGIVSEVQLREGNLPQGRIVFIRANLGVDAVLHADYSISKWDFALVDTESGAKVWRRSVSSSGDQFSEAAKEATDYLRPHDVPVRQTYTVKEPYDATEPKYCDRTVVDWGKVWGVLLVAGLVWASVETANQNPDESDSR